VKILGVDLGQGKSAWELVDTRTGEVLNGKAGVIARNVEDRHENG